MSPFTVAITILRFFEFPPPEKALFMTSNAPDAASALIRSWGRKSVLFSNPLPTSSRAGIICPFITSSGAHVFKSSAAAASASVLSPFSTQYFSEPFSPLCAPFSPDWA